MEWNEKFDVYCERLDPGYWAEPVNALTNVAFLIAALVLWHRVGGLRAPRVLCAILFIIGIGSYLFHTHATAWASTADTVPVGIFILAYLFLVNRDVLLLPGWIAVLGTCAFVPYAFVLVPLLEQIPFIRISDFYWTVPLLLLLYAGFLHRRQPATARGLLLGAGLLSLSISLRSLDQALCAIWPPGTHFIWHLLNALMLGWMIEVYRRQLLAGSEPGR